MPRPRSHGGRPRRRRIDGAFSLAIMIAVVVVAGCFSAVAAATSSSSAPSPEPFFPLGPASDCSPAGVSMAVFPLSREEAESCAAAKKKECRVPKKPTATTTTTGPTAAAASAETVFFSWSPLSESDASNSTATTLLDTTGTPVRASRMPEALFSVGGRGPLSSSAAAPAAARPPAAAAPPSPPPAPAPPLLPTSFALVSGRLLLEAAGNYTFYLSSDGLAGMELGGSEGGSGGDRAFPATTTTTTTATTTFALSRPPQNPLTLLLASAPRAVDFSIGYVPDPAAASHHLSLEWEFREGSGGAAGSKAGGAGEEQRSSSSSSPSNNLPKGNRRAIERGAVWPSALVGPKCRGASTGL